MKKIAGMSWNKHLTEVCIICSLHLKYVLGKFWKFEVIDSVVVAIITWYIVTSQ